MEQIVIFIDKYNLPPLATPGQQMSCEPAHEQSIAMEFRTHKANDVAIVGVVVVATDLHIHMYLDISQRNTK